MSKNKKIYYESFEDAIERNRKKVPEVHKKLKSAGVKYVLSSWIDLHGVPKTKPVPLSDFELLCLGKGPQFAAHSISFVPELTPADSDQVPLSDQSLLELVLEQKKQNELQIVALYLNIKVQNHS